LKGEGEPQTNKPFSAPAVITGYHILGIF
jgi:hypothetical protein